MRRRGFGDGTITQRADGRFEARISLGFARNGHRVRKSMYGKTRRDAQRLLTKALRERDQGIPIAAAERRSVQTYLEDWLNHSARVSVRPRTLTGYSLLNRKHITPAVGRIALSKLTPAHVQAMLNGMSGAGASAQTVRNAHAVLRRALNQAVRWGLLPRNVATLVDLPRVHREEVKAMSPRQAHEIVEAVKGDRIEAPVIMTLATGLRQGEALALRWRDLDLDSGQLEVRHTLQRLPGRGPELVEPKTKRSRRSIALGPRVVALLRAHRARQLEERLLAGTAWTEGDFVFTTTVGTPMVGGDLTKRFQRMLTSAGLPRLRFHDLRHGAASILLSQGVQPRVVMELLGHSTIALTMNVYSHVIPELQRDAAERMDLVLSREIATGS